MAGKYLHGLRLSHTNGIVKDAQDDNLLRQMELLSCWRLLSSVTSPQRPGLTRSPTCTYQYYTSYRARRSQTATKRICAVQLEPHATAPVPAHHPRQNIALQQSPSAARPHQHQLSHGLMLLQSPSSFQATWQSKPSKSQSSPRSTAATHADSFFFLLFRPRISTNVRPGAAETRPVILVSNNPKSKRRSAASR